MTAKKILSKLGFEGLSFSDLNLNLKEPAETKLTAEEIAAEIIDNIENSLKCFRNIMEDIEK